MSEWLPVHHVSEPSIILAALVRHATAAPDANPFPRFRLWRWWPRARPAGHPYDDENTYVYPSGSRGCRACQRGRRGRVA